MSKRVLFLDHAVSQRDDRGSAYLKTRGHQVTWVRPAGGESLPDIGEHDALVVYGGAEMLSTDLDSAEFPHLRTEVDYIGRWLAADKPYLGICLGSQLMATALGAKVGPLPDKRYELGFVRIQPTGADESFMPEPLHMYQWHQEGWELPQGAEHLATGPDFKNQAMRHGRHAYGLQFHPEVAPPTFQRWLDEVPDACSRLGAQSREKQVEDARLHDDRMRLWFEGFLDRWLAD